LLEALEHLLPIHWNGDESQADRSFGVEPELPPSVRAELVEILNQGDLERLRWRVENLFEGELSPMAAERLVELVKDFRLRELQEWLSGG